MSDLHEIARKDRLRREIEDIKLTASTTEQSMRKGSTRFPRISSKKVHFPAETELTHIRAVTPHRSPRNIKKQFQTKINRLIIEWIQLNGSRFRKQWIKENPQLPHVTDDDYEEQVESAVDEKAREFAYQVIEQEMSDKLQQIMASHHHLGGGTQTKAKSSPWIDFVKDVQKRYQCSFKKALVKASKLWKKSSVKGQRSDK